LNGKYSRGSPHCRILLNKNRNLYKRKRNNNKPTSRRAEVATAGREPQAKNQGGLREEI